jgi:hypothetical protein
LHVAKPFFAVALGLFIIEDALRKVIRLANELRRILFCIRLVDGRLAVDFRFQVQPLVGERRLDV